MTAATLVCRTVAGAAVLATCVAAPSAPSYADDGQAAAVAVLERAAVAGHTLAYRADQYLSLWSPAGSRSVVLHVTNIPGVGVVAQPMQTSDATAAGGSSARAVVVASTAPSVDEVGYLRDRFRLVLEPADRDADDAGTGGGQPTDVVAVYRHDGTVAGRLWVDDRTGLVVRREVRDASGRLVRMSALLSVHVTAGAAQLPVHATTLGPATGAPMTATDAAARVRHDGFVVPATLPGGLQLYDARITGAGRGRVLHLTYFDGLSTLSLFEQRGRLDASALQDWRRSTAGGATVWQSAQLPTRATWSGGDDVFTAVGDVSSDTLGQVVGALPHRTPDRGVVHRLARGFSRMASWIDPFS